MSPVLTNLVAEVRKLKTVAESATAFINGVPALIQQAKDQALANGATAEELAPFDTLDDEIAATAAELTAAILANTPAAPQS